MKYSLLAAGIVSALSLPGYAQQQVNTDEQAVEVITVKSSRGLISYVSASGAKSDTPIIETPLSVSVLTEERIADLGALTVQDALGYVSGLYNGPYGLDTRGDWSQIRGVSPVQYLDGLKSLFGYYNNVRIAPYALQQIEILKGPSSVLYGQGSIGGIVNLVSKKPEPVTSGQLWAQLGNYSRKQLAGDISGALNADASLQGRMVALWRDSDTQTDYVPDNSVVLAPSFSWQASQATKITLLANYQQNESGSSTQFLPHRGSILPNEFGQIPINRFVSEPGFDKYDTEQTALTAIVEHDLSADWQLRLASRYSDSHADYHTMYGWPPVFQADNRNIRRLSYVSSADSRALTSDFQLHGNLQTGVVEHKLVAGVDYQHAYTDNDYIYGDGGLLDLYNPVYGQAPAQPGKADVNELPSTTNYQTGLYLQDNMKIAEKWLLSAAIRRDKATTNPELATSTSQYATTGRLGFMYLLDSGISPYVSFSESFEPLLGNDAFGKAFVPKKGQQWEAGLKFQPKGTEHLITAAVFDITEQNRTTTLSAAQAADPAVVNPNGQVQDGEVTSKGVELEAQLAWDELDIYASYAYIDAYVSKSNRLGEAGATLAAQPEHLASIWATWRPAALENWQFGAGMRYVGETSDGTAYVEQAGVVLNTPLTTDSYTLVDAMVGYNFGNYQLSLQAQNITDETVITSCLARGDCFYGQRRAISANLRYSF
ncbi:MAG: TonB-dependent siderophore receptor [Gammaproteobacteria bacterium]|nr:TonB-dependent siderophore receptor [Gammaproteobacteria bacterium]MBU1556270.1 TonB-dependent siderophore receptor [Gammaproteobacteria bacterium]MBU2071490.1 TonB-dependent siderophore receptor [Gammaproteobacteria bacterium]MBU2181518.1 TonB-dependent siderophore receptor [Gammaproteobacteria bacterium]MBU2203744.1 TonB-dependent siderophore receptor [Gammaproteobacteria bacterium]